MYTGMVEFDKSILDLKLRMKFLEKEEFNFSKFSSTITIANSSKFTEGNVNPDSFQVPVKVYGRLFKAGKNKDGFMPPGELKKSIPFWQNMDLITYHDTSNHTTNYKMDEIKGSLINIFWNEKDQALDYVGEIYDKYVAYLIYLGKIRDLSVEIAWQKFYNNGELWQTNIRPGVVAMVKDGSIPDAKIYLMPMAEAA